MFYLASIEVTTVAIIIVKVRQPGALLFAEELNVTGTKISPLTLTQHVESR